MLLFDQLVKCWPGRRLVSLILSGSLASPVLLILSVFLFSSPPQLLPYFPTAPDAYHHDRHSLQSCHSLSLSFADAGRVALVSILLPFTCGDASHPSSFTCGTTFPSLDTRQIRQWCRRPHSAARSPRYAGLVLIRLLELTIPFPGSCGRSRNDVHISCTTPVINPSYGLFYIVIACHLILILCLQISPFSLEMLPICFQPQPRPHQYLSLLRYRFPHSSSCFSL